MAFKAEFGQETWEGRHDPQKIVNEKELEAYLVEG